MFFLMLSLFIKAEGSGIAEGKGIQNSKNNEPIVYTIKGQKDPRLNATYTATYASTSTSRECSTKQATTASRKPSLGYMSFPITDEHYQIEVPVYMSESDTACGYEFRRIELLLQRPYENEGLYSVHIILNRFPEAEAIYRGFSIGMANLTTEPAKLKTNKKYFRIAKETEYRCSTTFYTQDNDYGFKCWMRIKNSPWGNKFTPVNKQGTWVTHPGFGVDKINNDILNIDIVADDEASTLANGKEVLKDYFRTLPKPDPTRWERLKNYINKLVN